MIQRQTYLYAIYWICYKPWFYNAFEFGRSLIAKGSLFKKDIPVTDKQDDDLFTLNLGTEVLLTPLVK